MIPAIRERLKGYQPKTITCERTLAAGVIVPLLDRDGETCVILTRRTESVRAHKGEVSFPGGMYEDGDGDTRETALRECCEEIGVRKRDVEILGRLDDLYTLTGFVITPYAGVIPYPYVFRPNTAEVAYLIFLPFRFLLDVKPALEEAVHNGLTQRVQSFHYEGDRIWGATCRILLKLRDMVGEAV